MQAINNPEDKGTSTLKAVSYFSTGILFPFGLFILLEYAFVDSKYSDEMDSWSKLGYAMYIFQFCYSVIAFCLLYMEQLSQSQNFMRIIVASILSLT